MEKGSCSGAGGSGDKFKGLQFGGKIRFEGASGDRSSSKSVNAPALTEVRPAAAGKKARGAAQGFGLPPTPPPKCQVEGCNLDLKGAKSYYCRHKVCGTHSKSPKVIVAGLEQRFCQQCSRFHLLKEFDQGKRSCRRRLAGHNERRRKPPPPELLPPHCGQPSSFPEDQSSCHRGYLMDFMHPRPPEAMRENISWRSLRRSDLLSASELALGDCIAGVSDSTCALSLLSNQLLGKAPASTSSAMPIDQQPPPIVPTIEVEAARANLASSYLDGSQGFADHEAGSSSSHEMELRQIHDAEIDQFSSIGIGPSEVYDHLHDFHWLL